MFKMKFLLSIYLTLLMAAQISWAAPVETSSTDVVSAPETPTHDKRYQLFDSLLLMANNIIASENMAKSSIYAKVLKDYSAWLEDKKPKLSPKKLPVYEEMKGKLQAYVTTSEASENNPTNCTLRQQAYTLLFDIAHIRNVLRRQEVNEIFLRHTETSQDAKFEEIKKNLLENDLPSMAHQVENFIASLDAVGRKENQDLINWFNVLQTKTTDEDKLASFYAILEIFLNENGRETKGGHVNCRLTVFRTSYEQIVQGVLNTYFTDLNQNDEE
ncbi:uncharacterized protein LOC101887203 [Musca domestica]|uniref:Uncharacterized protein LOC101887203 n=1 Tax=Musca domestica TaxID=7370 RepID=A0A1I8NGZ7_MUSDO|nr:uncharacterized protein LOC101887203 [Musca domestica]